MRLARGRAGGGAVARERAAVAGDGAGRGGVPRRGAVEAAGAEGEARVRRRPAVLFLSALRVGAAHAERRRAHPRGEVPEARRRRQRDGARIVARRAAARVARCAGAQALSPVDDGLQRARHAGRQAP